MPVRNTILIRGRAVREDAGIASGSLTPGMLVEPTSTNHYKAHDTPGGAAALIFVRENFENNGNGIDDAVASGSNVPVLFVKAGDIVNAVTDDTIDKDEFVESAGDGKVQPYGSGYRIGYARAASDLSGTVGRVEIVIAPVGV